MQNRDNSSFSQDYEQLCNSDWLSKRVRGLLKQYLRYNPREGVVEDICQMVGEVVWEKRRRYNPNQGDFWGWVYGIAENCIKNWLRRHQNWRENLTDPQEFQELRLETSMEPPAQRAVCNEQRQILHEQIEKLSPLYRDVLKLVLRFYTPAEIAEELGITPETARKRYLRAVKMLRNRYQKQGLL